MSSDHISVGMTYVICVINTFVVSVYSEEYIIRESDGAKELMRNVDNKRCDVFFLKTKPSVRCAEKALSAASLWSASESFVFSTPI